VPTENTVWQGDKRFAGISAFGMSGTNVHLIVGQAPPTVVCPSDSSAPGAAEPIDQVLTVSAQSAAALPELAARYAALMELNSVQDLSSLCFSAATGRSHLTHRAAFTADSNDSMTQLLAAFASGQSPHNVTTGSIGRRAPKIAFLFTGQGAQHVGMGQALYQTNSVFRHWLDTCAGLFEPYIDKPLLDFLWAGEALHQTAYTQPALFAIEYSLAKLFEAWVVVPDLLLGHSIGEYAAACIAGVFTLEEGVRLVAARGRLMQSLPSGGQMLSVAADEATVRDALGSQPDVSVAAVNAPQSIVVSGRGTSVDAVAAKLQAQGVKTTALKVSHAFHSPMMDPILEEFRAIASTVTYNKPCATLLSNVTGKPWGDDQLCADYWVDHLRGAVRFADGISYAQNKKFQTFVEIGPRPTLSGLGRACVGPDYGHWL
ncbi:MAG: acyltransferase domain-containing protein, partial [Pseudomonadota bacterium]